MSLKHEPASEPLHIYVKKLFLNQCESGGEHASECESAWAKETARENERGGLWIRTLDGPASGDDFRHYASRETTLGVEAIHIGGASRRVIRAQ